jgi:hypothetical protein
VRHSHHICETAAPQNVMSHPPSTTAPPTPPSSPASASRSKDCLTHVLSSAVPDSLADAAREAAAVAHAEAAKLRARIDDEVADVLRRVDFNRSQEATAAWERFREGAALWRVIARSAAYKLDVEAALFCGSVANCAAAGVAFVAMPVVYVVTSSPGEKGEREEWRRFRKLRCALWTVTTATVSFALAASTNAGWDAYGSDDDDLALACVFGAPVATVVGIFAVSKLVDWFRPALADNVEARPSPRRPPCPSAKDPS